MAAAPRPASTGPGLAPLDQRSGCLHTSPPLGLAMEQQSSGGDQQLISGKLSRFFDEESRCSNMSSCSMHALTLRMMSFLTVRALSPRLGARGTNVRARRVGGARPCTWQAISTLKTTNAGPQGPQRHRSRSSGYCRSSAAKCPECSRK